MGEAIEEGRGHPGVAEDLHPLGEAEVGGEDQGGLFVEVSVSFRSDDPQSLYPSTQRSC